MLRSWEPSTRFAGHGRMLIVDASSLYSMLAGAPQAERIRRRLAADPDKAAPHVIDVEVLGVIRREFLFGRLDRTAAFQAVEDLRDWSGRRFGYQALLDRAWELRANVRGSDAMYVALAELLRATLITTDARLARASGPRCRIEVLTGDGA
jgi:predicted nucleic acid-binding protein